LWWCCVGFVVFFGGLAVEDAGAGCGRLGVAGAGLRAGMAETSGPVTKRKSNDMC
jgi:hypothetical protein